MMTRSRLESVAKESGFRPVAVEKVMRLSGILRRLDSHPTTEGKWLLKGGTALNLLHLDVPRMSVDIDLNYVGSVDRAGMIAERPGFEAALVSICEREGCTVKRTPSEHAGGKFTALMQRSVPRDAFDAADGAATVASDVARGPGILVPRPGSRMQAPAASTAGCRRAPRPLVCARAGVLGPLAR